MEGWGELTSCTLLLTVPDTDTFVQHQKRKTKKCLKIPAEKKVKTLISKKILKGPEISYSAMYRTVRRYPHQHRYPCTSSINIYGIYLFNLLSKHVTK